MSLDNSPEPFCLPPEGAYEGSRELLFGRGSLVCPRWPSHYLSRDWTGTLMVYIVVFVAGMIVMIAVLSLLAASIRYALDRDGTG